MKKFFYTPVLVALLTAFTTVRAETRPDYLGLPGDNLNLFAVMKLFQESETLEGFERNLNDQNNYINNLDLNGDGYVDYIRVIDNVDRNVHFIVLQVAINPRENQDVAVFTVVQESNGQVSIQLVGDEALYGRDYIVEPIYDETPNPGYTGRRVNGQRVTVVHTNYYEVASWPVVRFIFMPTYVVWHSPWYWDYYPVYWRPWNPFYWHHYYGYHYNYYSWYYGHYHHHHNYRHNYWHDTYYAHHHVHSPYVHSRITQGSYKKTYSKPETRNEGVALYQRTRSAGGGPATNVSSSSRRTSDGGTVRQSTGTTRSRETTTSGTRTTGSRQATGTRQTTTSGARQSTTTGNRGSSGTQVRSSSTTGGNRESVRTETRNAPTGTTRQSTSTTTTKRTTTTTRQSSTNVEPAARNSERRTSVSSGSGRSSSSGQSVSKSTSQRSGGSVSSSDRRSGSSSGNSGSGNAKSTEKSSRTTGRR